MHSLINYVESPSKMCWMPGPPQHYVLLNNSFFDSYFAPHVTSLKALMECYFYSCYIKLFCRSFSIMLGWVCCMYTNMFLSKPKVKCGRTHFKDIVVNSESRYNMCIGKHVMYLVLHWCRKCFFYTPYLSLLLIWLYFEEEYVEKYILIWLLIFLP